MSDKENNMSSFYLSIDNRQEEILNQYPENQLLNEIPPPKTSTFNNSTNKKNVSNTKILQKKNDFTNTRLSKKSLSEHFNFAKENIEKTENFLQKNKNKNNKDFVDMDNSVNFLSNGSEFNYFIELINNKKSDTKNETIENDHYDILKAQLESTIRYYKFLNDELEQKNIMLQEENNKLHSLLTDKLTKSITNRKKKEQNLKMAYEKKKNEIIELTEKFEKEKDKLNAEFKLKIDEENKKNFSEKEKINKEFEKKIKDFMSRNLSLEEEIKKNENIIKQYENKKNFKLKEYQFIYVEIKKKVEKIINENIKIGINVNYNSNENLTNLINFFIENMTKNYEFHKKKLLKEIEKLKYNVLALEKEKNYLENQNEDYIKIKKDLEELIENKDNQIKIFNEESISNENINKKNIFILLNKNNELNNNLNERLNELEIFQKKIMIKEEQLKEKKNENLKLFENIKKIEKEKNEINNYKYENLEKEKNDLEKLKKNIEKNKHYIEKEKKELEKEKLILENEKKNFETNKSILESNRDNLSKDIQNKINSLNEENINLKEKLDICEKNYQIQIEELNKFYEKNYEINSEDNIWNNQVQMLKEKINELETEKISLQASFLAMKASRESEIKLKNTIYKRNDNSMQNFIESVRKRSQKSFNIINTKLITENLETKNLSNISGNFLRPKSIVGFNNNSNIKSIRTNSLDTKKSTYDTYSNC